MRVLLDPKRVRARRHELGLYAYEVAARAGISKQMLSDIEAGRRQGSAPTRRALAKALRLPLAELCRQQEEAAS